MMSRRMWVALVAGAMLAFGSAAQAMVIDTFEDGTQTLTADSTTPTDAKSDDATSALGGERDVRASYESGDGVVEANVNVGSDGEFDYSTPSGTSGEVWLEYDGDDGDPESMDTDGMGGFDLTDGGLGSGITVEVGFQDRALDLRFRVWSPGDEGDDMSEGTLSLPGSVFSGTETYELAFSEFTGDADMTNVTAIEVYFDAARGTDFVMSQIGTATIPAPAALPGGLMLMGVLGGFRYRRRRQVA